MSMESLEIPIHFLKHNLVILFLIAKVLWISYSYQFEIYLNEVKRLWFLVLVQPDRVVSDGSLTKVWADLVPQDVEELRRDWVLIF